MKVIPILLTLLLCAPGSLVLAAESASAGAGSEADFVNFVNKGVSLAQKGNAADAIVEFQKAQAIKPDDPSLLVNLGQAYQLTGKNVEALEQYKKYLKLYPNGQHVPQITSMFKVMKQQIMLSGGKTSQGKDNYLQEAAAPGGGRWTGGDMPLRIYVKSGAGVEGYKDEFVNIFKKSFADWSDASEGKIKAIYVDSPEKANIICKWTDNAKDLANPAEGGQAYVQMAQRAITKADIILLTHNSNVPASVPAESYMRLICLHEIGHALGLAGHSSEPSDVMFSLMTYEAAPKNLTSRDMKTIQALYSEQ